MGQKNVHEFLRQNQNLFFDGAMGTYYATKTERQFTHCESACLTEPETIKLIHHDYIEVGVNAIKTNTFAANRYTLDCGEEYALQMIDAACELARSAAAGREVFTFADIGPVPVENPVQTYLKMAGRFLTNGMENYLFETLPNAIGIPRTAAFIKSRNPNAFIIVSFAAMPDGYTRHGLPVTALLEEMDRCEDVDAIGVNCIAGPYHLKKLIETFPAFRKPLSVMPNSGYPTVIDGRTYFNADALYFGELMAQMSKKVTILGGCCGTTPKHIRKMIVAVGRGQELPEEPRQELPRLSGTDAAQKTAEASVKTVDSPEAAAAPRRGNPLLEKLIRGTPVIAVELDPPADAEIGRYLENAAALKLAGADVITIADCPTARVRADSSILAAKLKRELDIEPLPHLTCRDRNLNATKALLLGLSIEGINSVLAVTGDPIPTEERATVKGVFNFNSLMLAGYIAQLNKSLSLSISVFGALNINAPNFDAELRRALKKEKAGVRGFLTQPAYTDEAFRNLELAYKNIDGFLLGGILPIVSLRNALFLQNEVSGIRVGDDLILKYRHTDKEEARKLAITLSAEAAQRMEPYVNGYYIITPFSRIDIVTEIIRAIRPAGGTCTGNSG